MVIVAAGRQDYSWCAPGSLGRIADQAPHRHVATHRVPAWFRCSCEEAAEQRPGDGDVVNDADNRYGHQVPWSLATQNALAAQ